MNADRVPIFTSSIITARGKKAAINAATSSNEHYTCNWRLVSWVNSWKIFLVIIHLDSWQRISWSVQTRLVRSTDVIPHNAPTDTIEATRLDPTYCNANATGAALFKSYKGPYLLVPLQQQYISIELIIRDPIIPFGKFF